jgi:methyl coenzyme M reductase alpha subunit
MPQFVGARRLAMAFGTAALLVGAIAMPASAGTVTAQITAGGLTASVADLNFASVTYNNAAHDVTDTMVVTADDSRGTGAGWSVTIQGSAFVYTGAAGGSNIPASAFALTSAEEPVWVAGQVVSLTAANGPQIPPEIVYGSLASPIKTIRATAAYGAGTYTQDLGVTLTIPAQSHVGTYTGTLTTTISATP